MTVTFITSERSPRFVARATCPSCSVEQVGITFHGVLMSGAKVYEIAAHTPGQRRRLNKQPRCEGSGARMQLTADGWRAAS